MKHVKTVFCIALLFCHSVFAHSLPVHPLAPLGHLAEHAIAGAAHSTTYPITHLPPGRYVVCVKAAGKDSTLNSVARKLHITVLDPWWNTWPAYVGYAALSSLLVWVTTRFFWLRGILKKENELYQMKVDFFTNISHEIRTHLTLIGIPVQRLEGAVHPNEDAVKLLKTASRNIDQMMLLVNELLDFRKIGRKEAMIYVREGDVIAFVRNCVASFEQLADEKQVVTSFTSNAETLSIWYDPGQLQKVFYNLLLNAYKFSPEGGNVDVSLTEQPGCVVVTIADNGVGIAPEHLENLFVNFFQVYERDSRNTGYGIGLALANRIVQLHGGTINVRSSTSGPRRGSAFSVLLFKGITHFNAALTVFNDGLDDVQPVSQPIGEAGVSRTLNAAAKYSVLLVEDNRELLDFCSEVLKSNFIVFEASNGVQGWEKVQEHIPDIVISDIMMPGIDGIQLCRNIKSDVRTNHIPVILLTAKCMVNHHIEGLSAGADDYIPKPFHIEILELKIRNMIATRKADQQKYAQSLASEPDEPQPREEDDPFLKDLHEIVWEQIGDREFTINELVSRIGMSKSVLYKKLRALTGMTVNDFVKMVRLQKASQLLKQPGITVGEVAQMVGFEDPKYFSREFRKQFGKLPKDWSMSFTNEHSV
ncbi:His Kinase A (phospho-acceptor) domain-containing protein [Dyadobacter sp. SG02]|uniref:hybrid sensor histidine kinase/response regulator transcription factor n=1 Tax=Dyadobacter sp. SG02 TaxID=1855291 RepID=UPI0008D04F52|nr:response regulator [Dyadobacter sp. SG02]SEI52266.1 His Kinase A (phospho-acceptor) domain-containing protein [Dyadobacter sp. SG02]